MVYQTMELIKRKLKATLDLGSIEIVQPWDKGGKKGRSEGDQIALSNGIRPQQLYIVHVNGCSGVHGERIVTIK